MENGQAGQGEAVTTPQQTANNIVNDSPMEAAEPRGFFSNFNHENSYEQDGGEQTEENQSEQGQEGEKQNGIETNETAQESEKERELYSRSMAMLAKKERAILERENKLKELETQKKPDDEQYQAWKKAMELKEYDPMGAIEALGLSFEQIQQHYSSDEAPTTKREALLQKKIDDLEKWRQDEVKSREERQKQKELEKQQEDYNLKAKAYINSLEETAANAKDEEGNLKYELVKEENEFNTVFEVVNQYWQKHKKVLSNEEALEMVENHLEQRYKKMLRYKKFGKYGKPREENNDFLGQNQNETPNQHNASPTTLTNSFSQSTPPASNRVMTREESIRKAAEMIQFDD